MGFIHDKQARRYYLLLIFLCAAGFLSGLYFNFLNSLELRQVLTESRQTMTSSLLQQGVSGEVAAEVLADTKITEQDWLLKQPLIRYSVSGALFISLLLGVSLLFINNRERLYHQALGVLSRFSEGDFRSTLPASEGGSIYHLFAAVNRLATALQAKSEAEHKNKVFMQEAISDISHQLKTPLAALNMYNEIIGAEPDHAEVIRRFTRKSGQALKRMEQLVQMLLKIMRLDAGSIIFEQVNCRVSEVVAKAIGDLTIRAELEGKTIVCDGPAEDGLYCDPAWTAEAFGNIVKNALDHTAPGGHIRIKWQRSPAVLNLSVSDDGSGITPQDIHRIFKRFYRREGGSDAQGVGLGLPLAKAIVEQQKGALAVRSEPGEGTTFTISFLTES